MANVDSYIMKFDPEVQRRLKIIRSAGLDIFQNAEEKIYHAVPTFIANGKDILNYGAYKNHITLYIGYELVHILKNKYPQYQYTKSAMKILNTDNFQDELIQEICVMLYHFMDG